MSFSELRGESFWNLLNPAERVAVSAKIHPKLGQKSKVPVIAGITLELENITGQPNIKNWVEVKQALNKRAKQNTKSIDGYQIVRYRDVSALNNLIWDGSHILEDLFSKHAAPNNKEDRYQHPSGFVFEAVYSNKDKQYHWGFKTSQIQKMLERGSNRTDNDVCYGILGYHKELKPDEIILSRWSYDQMVDSDLAHSLIMSEIGAKTYLFDQIQYFPRDFSTTIHIKWRHVDMQLDVAVRETNNEYVLAIKESDYLKLKEALVSEKWPEIKKYNGEVLPNMISLQSAFPDLPENILRYIWNKLEMRLRLSPLISGHIGHIEGEHCLATTTDHWQIFYPSYSEAREDGFRKMENHPDYPSHVEIPMKVVLQKGHSNIYRGVNTAYGDDNNPDMTVVFAQNKRELLKTLKKLAPIPVFTQKIKGAPEFLNSHAALQQQEVEISESSFRAFNSKPDLLYAALTERMQSSHFSQDGLLFIELPDKEKIPVYSRSKKENGSLTIVRAVKIRDLAIACEALGLDTASDYKILESDPKKMLETLSLLSSSPTALLNLLLSQGFNADDCLTAIKGLSFGVDSKGIPVDPEQEPVLEATKIVSLETDLNNDGKPNGHTFVVHGIVENATSVKASGYTARTVKVTKGNRFSLRLPSPSFNANITITPVREGLGRGESVKLKVNGYSKLLKSELLASMISVSVNLFRNQDETTRVIAMREMEKWLMKSFNRNFNEGMAILHDTLKKIAPADSEFVEALIRKFKAVNDFNYRTLLHLDFAQKYAVYEAYSAYKAGEKGYLLGMPQGTGKTRVALVLAGLMKDTVIVVPKSLMKQWKKQVESDGTECFVPQGKRNERFVALAETDSVVTLINRESIRGLGTEEINAIKAKGKRLLIVDEAQYLANDSQMAAATIGLSKATEFTLALSGTFFKNLEAIKTLTKLVKDAEEIIRAIDAEEKKKSLKAKKTTRKSVAKKDKKAEAVQDQSPETPDPAFSIFASYKRLTDSSGIHLTYDHLFEERVAGSDHPSVPNLRFMDGGKFNLTTDQLDAIQLLLSDPVKFLCEFQITPGKRGLQYLSLMSIYRAIVNDPYRFHRPDKPERFPLGSSNPKMEACNKLVKELIAINGKIVIFPASRYDCQVLADTYTSQGHKVALYYSGKNPVRIAKCETPRMKSPGAAQEAFNGGEADILIMTPQSGGTGLDLYTATHQILFDLPISGITYEQTLRRGIRRSSQVLNVDTYLILPKIPQISDFRKIDYETYKRLFGNGTFEDRLLEYLQGYVTRMNMILHGLLPPEMLGDIEDFLQSQFPSLKIGSSSTAEISFNN